MTLTQQFWIDIRHKCTMISAFFEKMKNSKTLFGKMFLVFWSFAVGLASKFGKSVKLKRENLKKSMIWLMLFSNFLKKMQKALWKICQHKVKETWFRFVLYTKVFGLLLFRVNVHLFRTISVKFCVFKNHLNLRILFCILHTMKPDWHKMARSIFEITIPF